MSTISRVTKTSVQPMTAQERKDLLMGLGSNLGRMRTEVSKGLEHLDDDQLILVSDAARTLQQTMEYFYELAVTEGRITD